MQELVANGTLQVTKVGTLSNPADIFTKFVSSETIQRQLHAVGLQSTKLIHAIHAIRCVPSDIVEVNSPRNPSNGDAKLQHHEILRGRATKVRC